MKPRINVESTVRRPNGIGGDVVKKPDRSTAVGGNLEDAITVSLRGCDCDPFAGGVDLFTITGLATYPGLVQNANPLDISGCIGANCSLGFQLQSDSSLTDLGPAIIGVLIDTLTLNATSYINASGTSMASPMVAGLATMLRAYNPLYTYADVANAIKQGGRAVPALAGKTTTGKAIDVVPSIAYINPPTGLTANVR